MRPSILKSRFLQSAAILVATASGASAAANTTVSNVNVLNLLSPFLSLNATAIGQTTLADNLSQSIAINNGASLAVQELAYSDKNLLSSASNTVAGLSGVYGVAANLAGSLPDQPAPTGGVGGVQEVGGLGSTLGAIYDQGVNGYAAGTSKALANTVSLLTSAYAFTSSDLGVAKFYFANGTINGTTAAVAPTGYTLPTYNGAPNSTTSVYDTAYGVTNTESGQDIYGDSRPVQVAPSSINQFDPTALSGLSTNPSFPSGHTTYAYTDSLLIGMLVPQLYQSMLSRAAQYANSRIVLGVHYPLDIIASRSLASYDLAQALNDPSYTSANLQSLFVAANSELSSYLASQCGGTVASCAASQTNPYATSAQNAATYAADLNYGLPTLTYAQAPREQAPTDGPDASILLATVYGGSSAAALTLAPNGGIDGKLATSTINQILVNTEGEALAAFYGTDLSYWSRINLYAALGYFNGVTGTLNTADGDHLTIDATVASGGVIDVTGRFTVDGNLEIDAGGALGFTLAGLIPETGYSQIEVGKKFELDGELDLTLGTGFDLGRGYSFDLVDAAGGAGADVTSLVLDGSACSAHGRYVFSCMTNNGVENLWLGLKGGSLTVNTTVPEPSTWAMMFAGFAALGFAGWRRASSRALA
jgi:hypothetical protein